MKFSPAVLSRVSNVWWFRSGYVLNALQKVPYSLNFFYMYWQKFPSFLTGISQHKKDHREGGKNLP